MVDRLIHGSSQSLPGGFIDVVSSLVKELKMGLGLQDFMAYAGFATTSMLPGEMVPNHKIVSAIDS